MTGVGEQRGQATVELVALLPVVVACVLAVTAVLAGGGASEAAGAAAEAGAAAIVQEGDPASAARQALDTGTLRRARIHVEGRRVTVTLRPDTFPAWLSSLLSATRSADAGPGPAAQATTTVVRGGDGESARPGDDGDARGARRP